MKKNKKIPLLNNPEAIIKRHHLAEEKRRNFESIWQDCYSYTLPQKSNLKHSSQSQNINIFDGTASDATEQLSAALLSELVPSWGSWFELLATEDHRDNPAFNEELSKATVKLRKHFNNSNFIVEMHQAFLDVVIAGTGSLMFEETPLGQASAFKFFAIPLMQTAFDEGPTGRLDVIWRKHNVSVDVLSKRFDIPRSALQNEKNIDSEFDEDLLPILEFIEPIENNEYRYQVLLLNQSDEQQSILYEKIMSSHPIIAFRWMKAPGEVYGRSPVMKVLPDIKTANKVVELVLKNASIAVTGIWQADDDGVLNPANIRLVPGAIIPKAVGSSGLTPLEAPGRFDISEIVLKDLRDKIKSGLLADALGSGVNANATATEVLHIAEVSARKLAANFGRLEAELMIPLLKRGVSILQNRGEIIDFDLDGNDVEIRINSPVAQKQRLIQVNNLVKWIQTVSNLGPEGISALNIEEVAHWLADHFNLPDKLLNPKTTAGLMETVNPLASIDDPSSILKALASGALGGEALTDGEIQPPREGTPL